MVWVQKEEKSAIPFIIPYKSEYTQRYIKKAMYQLKLFLEANDTQGIFNNVNMPVAQRKTKNYKNLLTRAKQV